MFYKILSSMFSAVESRSFFAGISTKLVNCVLVELRRASEACLFELSTDEVILIISDGGQTEALVCRS